MAVALRGCQVAGKRWSPDRRKVEAPMTLGVVVTTDVTAAAYTAARSIPSPGSSIQRVTNSTDTLTPEEVARALDIARELVGAGVPVFVGRQHVEDGECILGCTPDKPRATLGGFHLPVGWQTQRPNLAEIDRWRPGDALCALGGLTADFLDADPRNGSDISVQEMRDAGHWPRSFGRQATPSGGTHDLISATGESKATDFMPGLDLQSGSPDGTGRGFVFISPTVKPRKGDGKPMPYRWVAEPDLAALREWSGRDDSQDGLISRVISRRSRARVAGGALTEPDGVKEFTPGEAERYCAPALDSLRSAQIGSIEKYANQAACTLSHFVPEFWSADQAYALLEEAVAHTAYDGKSGWTMDKFRVVLDGRRPPRNNWKAEVQPEADLGFDPGPQITAALERQREAGSQVASAAPDREAFTGTPKSPFEILEELEEALLDRDALDEMPPVEPLIDGVLDLQSESWIIGVSGSFKSFVALDMAAHVALGLDWRGQKVTQGNVVYMAAEGAKAIAKRVGAWEATYGHRVANLDVLPMPVQVSKWTYWQAFTELCRRRGAKFVILDTQARITVGLEENGTKDMSYLTEAVRYMKERTGACVLVVHHIGRNGGDARGSSSIDGAQDAELRVERASKANKQDRTATLSIDKSKDGDETPVWNFEMDVVVTGQREDGQDITSLALKPRDPFAAAEAARPMPWHDSLTENQTLIMSALRDHGDARGHTVAEIKAWLRERATAGHGRELPTTSVRSALRDLVKKDLAAEIGKGWALQEHLDEDLPA